MLFLLAKIKTPLVIRLNLFMTTIWGFRLFLKGDLELDNQEFIFRKFFCLSVQLFC
jgi:hypothetical protein